MADALTDADIRKIAKLSRLSLPDSHIGTVRTQLESVLGHISKLQSVPVEGVEPMAHPQDVSLRLREDVVTDGGKIDAVLSNAPKSADGFFVVPKVVE